MKWIKQFEAFESDKLSATLKYIDKNSNQIFIKYLKEICDIIDYPYSDLNDDIFEYLPFTKAYNKIEMIEDVPCDSKNEWDNGENCKDGFVMRPWGKGTRRVTCGRCGGSGIKPTRSGDIKLIKFWFTKDGVYNRMTGVDGVPRITIKPAPSYNKADYTVIGYTHVSSLKTGDIVLYNSNIGVINKVGSRIYFLNNVSGSSPIIKSVAKYSILISSYEHVTKVKYHGDIKNDDDDKFSPDRFNFDFSLNYGIFQPSESAIYKSDIDGDFAIILDFSKLRKLDYKHRTLTKKSREESRQGSSKLISDDDIRQKNIDNYISKLCDKYDIDNMDTINNIIKRSYGHKHPLNNLSYLIDNLSLLVSMYARLLTNEKNYDDVDRFKMISKKMTQKGLKTNYSELNKNVRDNITSEQYGVSPLKVEVTNIVDELNDIIKNKIESIKIENLEDLENLRFKVINIRDILSRNSYGFQAIFNYAGYPSIDSINYRLADSDITTAIKHKDTIYNIIKKL